MYTTTLYKEDFSEENWNQILIDLELPKDTDEIIAKEVTYITQSQREKEKVKTNVEHS